MRRFDGACLMPVEELRPEEIKRIREKAKRAKPCSPWP
jgi:DNA-binding transcriptional regulator YiaG